MHASSSSVSPSALWLRSGGALVGVLTCLAGLGLSSTHAHADAAACKALEDAMIANTKTPYHSFSTIGFEYAAPVAEAQRKMKLPRQQKSETIFTGKVVYFRLLPGKWQMLRTPLAQFQANVRVSISGLTNCKRLADVKDAGTTLAVYLGGGKNHNKPVVTKVWVSPKGIPVKAETDIDDAGPPGVEEVSQRLSTRYEYGDVHAPSID